MVDDPIVRLPSGEIAPSPKEPKYRPTLRFGLWPVIDGVQAARWAVKQGLFAAVFCSCATVVFAVWAHYSAEVAETTGLNLLALLDAAIFAAIAVGMYFNSRLAAVAGLLLYVVERVGMWRVTKASNLVLIVILTLCYVAGVRGTFALHRFRREAKRAPNAPIVP